MQCRPLSLATGVVVGMSAAASIAAGMVSSPTKWQMIWLLVASSTAATAGVIAASSAEPQTAQRAGAASKKSPVFVNYP